MTEANGSTFRFTFLLDGLGDPATAQKITRAIHDDMGIRASSDPAGMWLTIETNEPITEELAERAMAEGRKQGLEMRDRVGTSFVSTITVDQLRARFIHEWSSRVAAALVFLVPALVLHYLTPILAQGSRVIPHAIEAGLVGWALVAGAWPILYQGYLALWMKRFTPDFFTLILFVSSFGIGLGQLVMGAEETVHHITALAILAATWQRTVIWRRAEARDGLAHRMAPMSTVLLFLLVVAMATMIFDVSGGLCVMLAVPSMLSVLSINRWGMGPLAALPVILFVALVALSPLVVSENVSLSARVESAFLFQILFVSLYGFNPPKVKPSPIEIESAVPND